MNPNSVIVEDAGSGYRKVVASPLPLDFVGINQIKAAVENGAIVVVGGGGGIPTIKDKKGLMTPVDGVIDKDFALSKLASLVKADCFVVLTAVDNVMINFNKPNQKALKHTNKKRT